MARDQSPPRGGGPQLQVGRYQVLSHIASGGMGAVYLAFDPLLNRTVALKVLSPEMAAKPNMVQRFQREAKAAAKLKHENIVGIFDFGEAGGTFFLALEFIDGTDLQDYIDQRPGGRLEVDETVYIAIQAAKALDHAHSQGIVHRDIKPSNFLVTTKNGKLFIKLTDMGLAREADDSRLTRDNTTLGTVDYISPEQARDAGSADSRSDLYSLGCTIFHMLVGHGPFPKGTLIEKVQHHLSTPAPDVRAHRSDVPDHLANVLFKVLAKEPNDRYETPLHLLHDLMSPAEFEDYLQSTKELDRPAFTPPVHHARTVEPTIFMAPEEMPEPDPLFPADFRAAEESAEPANAPKVEQRPVPEPQPEPITEAPESVILEPIDEPASSTVPAPVEMEIVKAPQLPATSDGKSKLTKPAALLEQPKSRPQKPAHATVASPAVAPREKGSRLAEAPHPTKTKSESKKPTGAPRPRTPAPAAPERLRRIGQRRMLRGPLLIGGIFGGLVFAAFAVWATMALFRWPPQPEPKFPDLTEIDNKPPAVVSPKIVVEEPKPKPPIVAKLPVTPKFVDPPPVEIPPIEPPKAVVGKMGPEVPEFKTLIKAPAKFDAAVLEREVVGPHGEFPRPENGTAVLRVTRGVAPQGETFSSFADAWREAAKRPAAIIEIDDHGPLAIPSLPALPATHLTIRAASGPRPVLIWDKKPGDKATTWMPLVRGSLILENLDLLVRRDDDDEAVSSCVSVQAGDASARDVTLTQTGRAKGGVALLRVAGRAGLASRSKFDDALYVSAEVAQLARVERCFLRGVGVVAVHLDAISADVLLDRSLVVGQHQPTIYITGQGSDVANVRALRSTLASSKAIVHFEPAAGQAVAPRLGVYGLDSLFVHPRPEDGGVLLSLDESVGISGLVAKIANSAFAGWPVMLRARQTKITTLAEWRTLWGHRDGDAVVPECWPPVVADGFDLIAPLNCSPLASPLAFSSLKNDSLIGCPVGLLPPEPYAWRLRAPASLPTVTLELPDTAAPAIDAASDGLYHGEVLDAAKITDLAEHLKGRKLAPRVVLHLAGKGPFKSGPLRLRETQLVLYAAPLTTPSDAATIEFQTPAGKSAAALLDVEKGSLDLINVRVRLDWKKLVDVPASLIRVRDGDLSMAGCLLQTPLTKPPAAFRSLIVIEASSPAAPPRFAGQDCVLLSSGSFVAFDGPAGLIRFSRSLVLTMDDAVILNPGPLESPPNFVARFGFDTFVLDKAFLRVQTPPRQPGCVPPMVVHSFNNHFSGTTPNGSALLLRCDGNALARGLLAWVGKENAYDLAALPRAVAWGRDVSPTGFLPVWTDLWGHAAEVDPGFVQPKIPVPKALNLESPNFDRYILSQAIFREIRGAPMQHLAVLLPTPAPKKK